MTKRLQISAFDFAVSIRLASVVALELAWDYPLGPRCDVTIETPTLVVVLGTARKA